IPYNPYEFRRLYGLIPIKYGYRKTVQFLTLEECKSFNEALEDMSNDLSLKQRAIGEILFHTAMRSCDIANLQLDSVDLQRQIINFTQIKTGKELTLPLLPAVGNAIYDYCTMERPISDSSILFLGDFAPHHKMTSQAVYYIVSKIMKRAEIRQKPGDRQGAHIFRHHAATTMLENNVPVPVISATLGHQSPKSLDSYLAANIPHLHECALSIDEYPVSEEVFNFDGV
ncbi:MAG: tyrosine-type recombinase/integrase, partial [Ruminococcus sp.]|nr:tyrosine-type recombinase/integrase [Ruminococcus sp.]